MSIADNTLPKKYAEVHSYIADVVVVGLGLQGKWSVIGKRVASGHKTLACLFVDVLDKKKKNHEDFICIADIHASMIRNNWWTDIVRREILHHSECSWPNEPFQSPQS